MRVIYKIARLELANLFYSPVAWMLLVILVFMMSSMFTQAFDGMTLYQRFGAESFYAVSENIFYGLNGMWPMMKRLLYFFMPLLTMGLVSQEFSRGSVKLLFSSPISSRQIVLGKYLGIMFCGLVIMVVLMLYVLVGWCCIKSFEWTAVLTGMLGLFLLMALYAAIGLFMSTLTTYQIVAAIGLFAMLAILNITSEIGQGYEFVREITYWLAIGKRADNFINGLICSEDLLYFMILSAMFVCFAILKMQLRRERASFINKTGRYLAIFVVAMLLGYITSRPMMKIYHDSTYNKVNTLTQASQDIVKKLDGGLKITTYVNLLDMNYRITHDRIKRDIARYDRFVRFKPEIELDYVFYYYADTNSRSFRYYNPGKTMRQAAEDQAEMSRTSLRRYLRPDEINRQIDLSGERYRFVSLIERENGRKTFLRTFYDSRKVPSEIEISAALKRIAMKLPSVGFVSDHKARSISGDRNRDYSYMMAEKSYRQALVNQGFDVYEIQLVRDRNMLDSLDVLVVAEPLEPFSEEELALLNRHIDNGKNLIVAGKPNTDEYLKPLTDMLGVRFTSGVLVQKSEYDQPANLLFCRVADEAHGFSRYFSRSFTMDGNYTMPGAAALEQVKDCGFRMTPLLVSRDSNCWNELQTIDFINEIATLDTASGEHAGTKITMLALNRERNGRDQRIIVVGDADCFSMGELEASRRGIPSSNGVLIDAMFEWLSYGELPVNTVYDSKIDNNIYINHRTSYIMTIVLKWVLPALLLLLGVVLLIRRKGK
ncbi:Gldg family protein [Butyricimonas hominis]|uniref:Gldg family protein n=1 Tax=Butyricimonas hominis TaxID=2763032 RepID=UPI0035197374